MKVLIACLCVMLAANCQQKKIATSIPNCIQSYIDSNAMGGYLGGVEEYEYQGKLVYAFGPSQQIKDGATLIKAADCKNLCSVGGFAGPRNSNCNGENFFEKAVLKRKIWPQP